MKRINIDLQRTGRFSSILHTDYVMRDIKSPRSLTNWIFGSTGNVQIAAQLLHVERVLNPILFSIRLAEVEVTCKLFRIRLLQVSS